MVPNNGCTCACEHFGSHATIQLITLGNINSKRKRKDITHIYYFLFELRWSQFLPSSILVILSRKFEGSNRNTMDISVKFWAQETLKIGGLCGRAGRMPLWMALEFLHFTWKSLMVCFEQSVHENFKLKQKLFIYQFIHCYRGQNLYILPLYST